MNFPFYRASAVAAKQALEGALDSANAGLLFNRFYNRFADNWTVDDTAKTAWLTWFGQTGRVRGDSAQIGQLCARQAKLCQALGGESMVLETVAPFVTGMGLSHPVENGFTFHPTLGTPYLPASGVKGLLRGWVEQWMDDGVQQVQQANGDSASRAARLADWFGADKGSKDDKGDVEGAGYLIFFDALPSEPVMLGCDVMTPHMGKWYENGGKISTSNYAGSAPADWHSPVPVQFLVVKKARFQFMIAPRLLGDPQRDQQSKLAVRAAMAELKNALEWLGAGAKTATGYGRMIDRDEKKVLAAAAELKQAGIKAGREEWPDAVVSWDKGRGALWVKQGKGSEKTAPLAGAEGRAMFNGLAEETRKRCEKGKVVLVSATVERRGNLLVLLRVAEG